MSGERFVGASRRQFLASLATLASSGALAGCSGVTDQAFEATPVGFTKEAQRELAMKETFADSRTVSREGGAMGVEGEVTVTSYLAAYRRDIATLDRTSEHRPTLVDSFVDRVNGRGDGGANRAAGIVAVADLGVDEVTLPVFEEAPTISGDAFSLVVPEGVRGGGTGGTATPFDDIICVAPISSSFIGVDEVGVLPPAFTASPKAVLPPAFWEDGVLATGGGSKSPDGRALLARWGVPDPDSFADKRPDIYFDEGQMLVVPGEGGLEESFGRSAEELPVELVTEGTTFDTGNNPFLLAVPGDVLLHPEDQSFTPQKLFDASRPAAMGGVGFGLGVISTPNEKLGGQSVSPLAEMPLEELLTSDQARQMVPHPEGGADTQVEWREGPKPVAAKKIGTWIGGQSPFTILDNEAELKTFAGVIRGDHGPDGPWITLVHVARVVGEDVVIAAGSQSTPVGENTDVGSGRGFASTYGPYAARGGGFTTVTGERLSPGVPDY